MHTPKNRWHKRHKCTFIPLALALHEPHMRSSPPPCSPPPLPPCPPPSCAPTSASPLAPPLAPTPAAPQITKRCSLNHLALIRCSHMMTESAYEDGRRQPHVHTNGGRYRCRLSTSVEATVYVCLRDVYVCARGRISTSFYLIRPAGCGGVIRCM